MNIRSFLPGKIGRLFLKCITIILACLQLATFANAQSSASLNGVVTDPSGAAVANASVTAKNIGTGIETTLQTDTSGSYLFPSLPIGTYRLEITAAGFSKAVVPAIALQVASNVTNDIHLQVGAVDQQVEISADAVLIENSTTSLSQVISDKTVQEIPLNGRHFTDLSLLTPGTITPPQNGFLSAPLRGQGSFGINTAGQREDTTNWLVNGINLNDPVQNQLTFQPPIDTLAEYKIDNSTFPAQYGRNSGAIVNLATRSGTNDFHGEAFDFFRNSALDARNFFNFASAGPQAPFKRNDFGASFGGPIKKNKAFFFVAYEGLRQKQQLTVTTTVPSLDQIATVTSPAVTSLLTLVPNANFARPNSTDVVADPATWTGFTGGAVANVSLNQGSADFDYDISTSDRLHAYYVIQKDLRQEPTQNANLPGFGDTRDGMRQLFTISEDHTFTAALTNTVRLGFNRIHLIFTPTALDPADFNITLPDGAPVGVGIPNIVVTGAMQFGGPTGEPQGRGDTTVALNDTLSWLKGRHTFAFGGEIRRAYNNNIAENVGSFTFTSMTNFLADSSSAFTVLLGAGNDKIVQPSYAGFAQDSFKLTPNFTIIYGLRYEWNSTPYESQDRFTNFDPASGTLVPASQPYATNNKNFQPRFGFAWDPFKDGKTSVRGGYAIMTQDPTTNIISGLSGNPLFAIPISVSSATSAITLEDPSAAITGVSLGPSAINSHFKNAYAQDWNLSVQRQVGSSLGIEVSYVGVKGTHLQLTRNVNQPFVSNGVYDSVRPFLSVPLSSTILPAQCAAPNPACPYGNINLIDSGGNSNYNALWVKATKHFSHGFEFLASYTFSKSLDYNSLSTGETYVIQNAYDPRADYGLSEFDVRHRFVLSGFYELPFQSNRLVSGWQFGIVTQAQSGSPLNPTLTIGPGPGISLTVRPDITGPISTTGNPNQWFADKSAFVSPCVAAVPPATVPTCTPGNLGRDAITGPGFVNTDFSVTKNTKITERFNLQFRTELFDIFNHPNFGNPVLTTTSAAFGQIQSTRFPTGDFGSSRQIQFALKLMF